MNTTIIVVLTLMGAMAVITFVMSATKMKRGGFVPSGASHPIPCDTDELVNRINDYKIREAASGEWPSRVRRYRKAINHRGRLVKVMVTDGREDWMHKMGVYGEQCDLMITEMKSILSADGVS